MTAIRSRKYIDGSRAQQCVFRIPGVCTGGGEDTVFAHIRDRHTGGAQKASDLSGGDCCFACHNVFDRRAKLPSGEYLSNVEWLGYALRALQETVERRHGQGLLFVGEDAVKHFNDRIAKPRKPPAERAKVAAGRPLQSRSDWPEGRKIPTRRKSDRRAEEKTS